MKVPFSLVMLIICWTVFAGEWNGPVHRLGPGIGLPQWASVTYQFCAVKLVSFEAHAGTALLVHSLGGRMIFGNNTPGFHPRAFLGLSLMHSSLADNMEDPAGTAVYTWLGGGFAWTFESSSLFLDLGYIETGARDRGIGKNMFTISGGLLFDL